MVKNLREDKLISNLNSPFAVLGPCVIESSDHAGMMAKMVRDAMSNLGFQLVFKASFEKANRTSVSGFRGPGIQEGLEILSDIRKNLGLPVTTDVHESTEVDQVASCVDVLQIPAFLCRQTRLLEACARSGRIVNVKKAQFMSGYEMARVVEKLRVFGAKEVIITERGTMFGYNNLVVDFRNIVVMKSLDAKVCIDATHSVQLPGGNGSSSGGQRQFAPMIARAAAIVGVDGYFLETHNNPDVAPSDGPNMIPVSQLGDLMLQISQIHNVREAMTPLEFEKL